MTEIIHINDNNYNLSIKKCADIIKGGGTVVFPTETVYGLGADAFNPEACSKIFKAKNRPADNPLIVHISNMKMLDRVAYIDDELKEKMKDIWPSPITLLLKKKNTVPDIVSAGLDTVCIRFPDNRIALDLIEASGPIAAPSANISTKPSIVDSGTAIKELNGRVDAIIDAGRVKYGVESTILDCTQTPYRLLRAGAFTVDDIEYMIGDVYIDPLVKGYTQSKVALTPGLKYRHYAPSKKLFLIENEDKFRDFISSGNVQDFFILSSDQNCSLANGECINLGKDIYEVAHNLFYDFRLLDASDKKYGVIQSFPENGIGLAVMNRIRKASFLIVKGKENIDKLNEAINETR
ncbi:L-threonylcarbamoyladenylate synthase [Ferroplasma sp.]|uniref:L-threonylcarbamoyladenylate synthase n=1 Tax=Ferroplasma sp. TaxID=2591003 RepID=UPI00307F8850